MVSFFRHIPQPPPQGCNDQAAALGEQALNIGRGSIDRGVRNLRRRSQAACQKLLMSAWTRRHAPTSRPCVEGWWRLRCRPQRWRRSPWTGSPPAGDLLGRRPGSGPPRFCPEQHAAQPAQLGARMQQFLHETCSGPQWVPACW